MTVLFGLRRLPRRSKTLTRWLLPVLVRSLCLCLLLERLGRDERDRLGDRLRLRVLERDRLGDRLRLVLVEERLE